MTMPIAVPTIPITITIRTTVTIMAGTTGAPGGGPGPSRVAGGGAEDKSELAKVERQIGEKVREQLKENKDLGYSQALKLVASENPDLDKRRTQLLREGGD